jgi:hypothetical protein
MRRIAVGRQPEAHGDLGARRIADDGGDLVDLVGIVGRKPPAAVEAIGLGDLGARLHRIVVVQAAPGTSERTSAISSTEATSKVSMPQAASVSSTSGSLLALTA